MANRVVWREGTFILPQHFQQQERFLLHELSTRMRQLSRFYWGLSSFQIEESELSFGQVSLSSITCVFTDGSAYQAPQTDKLPAPLHLENGLKDAVVYLILPLQKTNGKDLIDEENAESSGRLAVKTLALKDSTIQAAESAPVEVGELNCKLAYEDSETKIPDGYTKLAIAKVEQVAGGVVKLDNDFLPNLLNANASWYIRSTMRELLGILSARGDSLASRVTEIGSKTGVSEYSEFLLLQTINRIQPLLEQLVEQPVIHPYELYQNMITLAGELSTYMRKSRRSVKFPLYTHDNLNECFHFVFEDIKTSFSVVLEQLATQIELSPPKNNIRAARLNHKALLDSGSLIIAVSAQIPEEELRQNFSGQTKIGPGEVIYKLVQSSLPGIKLNLLSHVPQEIPYHSGYCYFELSKKEQLWHDLKTSNGLAIHVADTFPGLKLQLWSINSKA